MLRGKEKTLKVIERPRMDARAPAFCSIEVLYSCILRCKMCHMWENPRSVDELSIDQWKRFIFDLKRFTQLKTSINITGGEPFLKENVLEIVRCAAQEGFSDISMTSNGFLTDTRLIKEIASSGLTMLSFSLDSINPETHDYLRGVNGSCDKVLAAIGSLLKEKGSIRKIGIQTIIMGPTLGGIPELIKWASGRNVSIYFMAIAEPLCVSLGPDWPMQGDFSFLWPHDLKKRNEVIDCIICAKEHGVDIGNSLAQLKAFKMYFNDPKEFVKKERKCHMDDGMLKVGPMGDVALCGQKGPIGNITSGNIQDIWFSAKAQKIREDIKTCKTNCPQMVNCYFEE